MDKVPCHLGIIIDGNRRWAKERNLMPHKGHRQGAKKIKEVLKWCRIRGIKILTLYAFSTENWKRSPKEVNFLMRLGSIFLAKGLKELQRENVRLLVIGQKEKLPAFAQKEIKKAEDLTKENNDFTLVLAISYGGRAEIVRAIGRIIADKVPLADATEGLVGNYLYTVGLPDPDLIIRTSGEIRTSGFLLWQSAYSEWYFTKKYWPDFSEQDLDQALAEYAKRQRRFGE